MGAGQRVGVARQQAFEAERFARGSGRARSRGRPHLLLGSRGDDRLGAGTGPIPKFLAVEGDADEDGRYARRARPEALAAGGGIDPHPRQPGETRDALGVVGVNAGGDLGGESRVHRGCAVELELARHVVAHVLRQGRSQVELREGGPQVQAGPADDDRAASACERGVDLGVRELGVAAGAPFLADVSDAHQAMLDTIPFLGAWCPAQDLEPAVDLKGIAGDRDRVLPTLAQELSRLDGDRRLAGGGRSEDGQDVHWSPGLSIAPRASCPRAASRICFQLGAPPSSPGATSIVGSSGRRSASQRNGSDPESNEGRRP